MFTGSGRGGVTFMSAHAGTLARSDSALVDRHFVRVSVAEAHVALLFADGVLTAFSDLTNLP